ncbi:MAG: Maf family protein [Bryobacteraceae bacterium]|nr:Maf family protein [Bryobacteraceae bacterium]MDW8379615.1 Maf family protein [Bryobacterales bacterium]
MLVLASQSPRRKQLLENAGFRFEVRAAAVDEIRLPGESPKAYVTRLAERKAFAIDCAVGEVVLAADTEVVVDGQTLGKPTDPSHAMEMLRLLSGRDHVVLSGICLRTLEHCVLDCVETKVIFRPLEEDEIQEYVQTGEPMDKAGGYAIQGIASRFVERIEGCFFNVVGLPVSTIDRHLRALKNLLETR